MTRDERHRWLFEKKEGHIIHFTQDGMPFRMFRPHEVFGGVVHINDIKCCIRIVNNPDAEKRKRLEVRFPHKEEKVLPIEETTLVGYMEICGNWKKGEGKCLFHPVS